VSQSNSRQAAIDQSIAYIDNGKFEEELAERVAYRTESQNSESLPELHRYLDVNIIPAFTAMGFTCTKFDNPFDGFGPFLLAERIEDENLPTVLGYGHGDVIRGQDENWSKGEGPWKMALDGDKLYGRGTADNKGQHTINMAAIREVLETRGHLNFNAKYLIEMGEENGCKGLTEVVEANKEAFQADVFIGSDGPRVDPAIPTMTLGCRGAENFDLVCDLRDGGHHSGNWGGLIADPGIILSNAISTIVSARGQIQIKDWLPEEPSALVKDALSKLTINAGPGAPEIDLDWGEPGLSPAAKVYAWSSFAVLAMVTGNPRRPVNAIAPNARAHCQLRYTAGMDRSAMIPALRAHLDANGFQNVQIEPPPAVNAGGFMASRTEPDDPWAMWVHASMERTIGEEPAVVPSMGGSICNEVFTDVLGIPAIWIPHSYAACSQHAPDEHLLMSVTRTAMPIMTGLYWDLGEGNTPEKLS
jgi:acetylornithine deacetylase/succinyl-diaminopimelate desuccinylase-like protein